MSAALSPSEAAAFSRWAGGFLVDAAPALDADNTLRRLGASVSGDPVTGIRIYRGGADRPWSVRVIPHQTTPTPETP